MVQRTKEKIIKAIIEDFFKTKYPQAKRIEVRVQGRSGEGDSQENWLFDLTIVYSTFPHNYQLVLRRDTLGGATQTSRKLEHDVIQVLHNTLIPVPKVRWLDAEGAFFERPGFIMERCTGVAAPDALLPENRLGFDAETRLKLAKEIAEMLASLHDLDWRHIGIDKILELPIETAHLERLKSIETDLGRYQIEPHPEFALVINWLRNNMPSRFPLVMSHGDYRLANLLLNRDGSIQAVVDWELARLSDPLDDLSWYLGPVQGIHLIPGKWEEDDFIKYYEQARGIHVDRNALHWWKVLNMFQVMVFVMKSMCANVDQTTDSIRTSHFKYRLIQLLLSMIGL